MNRETLTARHQAQIEAMLVDDYDGFRAAARDGNDLPIDVCTSHYHCWVNTGGYGASLFGVLPNSGCCLTQAKGTDFVDWNGEINWKEKLGLADNDLIPGTVFGHTRFTREQLQEFSRLQLKAHFP